MRIWWPKIIIIISGDRWCIWHVLNAAIFIFIPSISFSSIAYDIYTFCTNVSIHCVSASELQAKYVFDTIMRSCDDRPRSFDFFSDFYQFKYFPLSDIFQETNRRFFRVYLIRGDRLYAFLSTNSIHNNNKSADEDHRLKIPSRLDDNRDESGASTSSVESIERSSSSRSTGGLQYTIH